MDCFVNKINTKYSVVEHKKYPWQKQQRLPWQLRMCPRTFCCGKYVDIENCRLPYFAVYKNFNYRAYDQELSMLKMVMVKSNGKKRSSHSLKTSNLNYNTYKLGLRKLILWGVTICVKIRYSYGWQYSKNLISWFLLNQNFDFIQSPRWFSG